MRRAPARGATLERAIPQYLDWGRVHAFAPGSGTPRTYGIKLGQYARHLGPGTPVEEVSGQQWYQACNALWGARSAETYNSGRRAALSFLAYCRDCEPPLTEAVPPKLWRPRRVTVQRGRGLPVAAMNDLFDAQRYPLRERSLWSVLYDSSERLDAVLGLDIQDLVEGECYARLRIKGGDTRIIAWTPETCDLLWEYIGERTWGPVWLGEVPPWNWRDRPREDAGPDRLYRLTAHRARCLYRELTGNSGLHPVRHTRLSHLGGVVGTNTAMLKAIGGHLSERMLARYAQPTPEQVVAYMADVRDKLRAAGLTR